MKKPTKKAAKMRWDEALPVIQKARKITGHVPKGALVEEPVVLTEVEWAILFEAVSDYADGDNGKQQLRNAIAEVIGYRGELAHRRGTRGKRGNS